MYNNAPIVLFVYNRPVHTKKTIDCLLRNKCASESELFVYSDACKNEGELAAVNEVRKYVKGISGFKKIEVVERVNNYGLANNVISGVSDVIGVYKKVVVLEDDLVTSPFFLSYMNDVLRTYENNDKVFSVTGFSFKKNMLGLDKDYRYGVYMNVRPMSWSWGTWYDRWVGIKWDLKDEYDDLKKIRKKRQLLDKGGTDLYFMLDSQMKNLIDSWYVRWAYNAIIKEKYTIYPVDTYVVNYGHDGSGVHKSYDKKGVFVNGEICMDDDCKLMEIVEVDKNVVRKFNKIFDMSVIGRVKRFLSDISF